MIKQAPVKFKITDKHAMHGLQRVEIWRRRPDGTEYMVGGRPLEANMVMLDGLEVLRDLIMGDTPTQKFVTKMWFGDNGAPYDASQPAHPATEAQAALINKIYTSIVTAEKIDETGTPDRFSVTFLGMVDYDEGVGLVFNEVMTGNSEGTGITYKTFRSQGKDADMSIRIYWTFKFYVAP